jgi:hypothetical protein
MANKKSRRERKPKVVTAAITTPLSLEEFMRDILASAKQRLLQVGCVPTQLWVWSRDCKLHSCMVEFRSFEEKRALQKKIAALLTGIRAMQAVLLSEAWTKTIWRHSALPVGSLADDPDRVECISLDGASARQQLLFQQPFYRSEMAKPDSKDIVFGELLTFGLPGNQPQVMTSEWFSGVTWGTEMESLCWPEDLINNIPPSLRRSC